MRGSTRQEEFRYFLTDHLGSVAAVADSAGTKRNSYVYDPWGRTESASEQVENRFRFAGREFDVATGFYYLRARYYDPATGRFLSEDPIGLRGGLNAFAYAANNPLTKRDPTGLCEDHGTDGGGDDGEGEDEGGNGQGEEDGECDNQLENELIQYFMDLGMTHKEAIWAAHEVINNLLAILIAGHVDPLDTFIAWVRAVAPGGIWDYKYHYGDTPQNAALGNVNYGVTGTALGLPDWALVRAGGIVQFYTRPELGSGSPFSAPFLDDSAGHANVKRGIEVLRPR